MAGQFLRFSLEIPNHARYLNGRTQNFCDRPTPSIDNEIPTNPMKIIGLRLMLLMYDSSGKLYRRAMGNEKYRVL